MKTIINTLNTAAVLMMIALAVGFTSCSTDWFDDADPVEQPQGPGNEWGNDPEVDPSNPNDVSSNSSVRNGNNPVDELNGNPPSTTTNVQHPARISNHVSNVEASSDQSIFLPFDFEVSSHAENISRVYVQITGANSYWKIEQISGGFSGNVVLSVEIPNNMKAPGEFKVNYRIEDDLGIVSNVLETTVKVVEINSCANFGPSDEHHIFYFDGSAGLTVRSIDLGTAPGKRSVTYDTKSIPDRVDIFYGKQWVHGTGSSIAFGNPPAISNCSNPGEGYVGTSDTFEFNYDPNTSKRLDVYISGCLDGSTYWELWVGCVD